MKKFTGTVWVETAASMKLVRQAGVSPGAHGLYAGLDVHKETIAVAVAYPGREAPVYRGEIANTPKALTKLVERLSTELGGEVMLWCYEAGACGYGIYRQLLSLGQDCEVVAPPRRERIKTDRRDALKLARKLRAGELTRVWVPGVEQEAMRDISRCRSDFKTQEKKAKQQLNGFVLRHGHHWPRGKSRWTRAHWEWLGQLSFAHPWQEEVARDYCEAVRSATERLKAVEQRMSTEALPQWSLAPVVDSLMALRGVDYIAAITLLAELGDLTRFERPSELMGYLGLVPSVHDSGLRGGASGGGHARWQWACAAYSGRIGVVLSVCCPAYTALDAQGKERLARGTGHRLAGPEAAVWALPDIGRGGEESKGRLCGHRTRAHRVRVGHRATRDAEAEYALKHRGSTAIP